MIDYDTTQHSIKCAVMDNLPIESINTGARHICSCYLRWHVAGTQQDIILWQHGCQVSVKTLLLSIYIYDNLRLTHTLNYIRPLQRTDPTFFFPKIKFDPTTLGRLSDSEYWSSSSVRAERYTVTHKSIFMQYSMRLWAAVAHHQCMNVTGKRGHFTLFFFLQI